jgi:Ni/Fe-hydrogenase subunit HybB-like protein
MRSEATVSAGPPNERRKLLPFILGELKPRGRLLTPFNVISAPVILLGLVLVVLRFAKGLGAVTNLSQEFPWGVWIGFDVITGVAFAGGAYVLTFMVYILRAEKYRPIVRATVLNGFLAYCFYAGALLLDLGRPWHIVNPIIGNKFGVSSVMFVVAWHFLLYTMAEFVEFFPAIAEWLGWKKVRKIFSSLTLATVIFGITLSTLHQAGLGGLFLLAKHKMHPLWYSEYIPHLFFVSSIFAGLSLVIVEGSISHKVFSSKLGPTQRKSHDEILVGLGRVCAGTMFVYFFMKILDLVHGGLWSLLETPMGYWYLVEILGFVLLPGALFLQAVRGRNMNLLRVAAVLTLLGIIVNRLNVSLIAFKWDAPIRYIPSWMEIEITAAVVLGEIWAFRWIVNRMPVLSDPPQWAAELDDH